MSSDSDDDKGTTNKWFEALRHIEEEVSPEGSLICFTHNGETALAFHARNGEHLGIMCSKCFKFLGHVLLQSMLRIARTCLHPARVQLKSGKIVCICGII